VTIADRLSTPQQPDARRSRAAHPKGFEPGVRYEGNEPAEVVVRLTEIPEDEKRWRAEIERVTSMPIPDHRRVDLSQVRYWGDPASPFMYCRFVITDRAGEAERLDLDEIIRLVRETPREQPPAPTGSGRALVIAWADLQVGKVGSRGGTEELIARVMSKLDALERYLDEHPVDSAYLIDTGDCIEGFENTPGQPFTNDLSLPEQLRVARRLQSEALVRLARRVPRVVASAVPSNHTKWRRGKGQLGKPGDDFGIENLVGIADAFALNPDAFSHVSFVVPDTWQETLSFDIEGTILAVAHGHQVARPDGVPRWWADQVHGGQPAADADVLLTGHFHHVRVQPTGRSHHTGRAKWWLQAPTLDNGSDWFRLMRGDDSDPALMVFTIGPSGWDDLKLL
jgi:hypothetical protein